MPPGWPPLCTSGASDGVSCGRVGRCFGLKKQKGRPKAAEIMSTTTILPHLDFQCRILGGGFFRTPTPQGKLATPGALCVDTHL